MDKIEELKRAIQNNPSIKVVDKSCKELNLAAFLVGGFLRDFFLGYESTDLDFIVEGSLNLLAHKAAGELGMKPIIMEKGPVRNIRLAKRGRSVDLTNLVGNSVREDLARRDFTINSLAYSLQEGEFVDLFGGLKDLRLKIIRSVTSKAFQEDPLRMLRAFRFACTLDNFSIAEPTLGEIREHAPRIPEVSVERTKAELDQILLTPKAPEVYEAMADAGLLQTIFCEFYSTGSAERRNAPLKVLNEVKGLISHFYPIMKESPSSMAPDYLRQTDNGGFSDLTRAEEKCLYYAAVFTSLDRLPSKTQAGSAGSPDPEKAVFISLDSLASKTAKEELPACKSDLQLFSDKVNSLMKRLRFSNVEIKKINNILMGSALLRKQFYLPSEDKGELRVVINKMGWDIKSCMLLFLAEIYSGGRSEVVAKGKEFITQIQSLLTAEGKYIIDPPVLLTGDEVSRITGLVPGVELGSLLKQIKSLQIKGLISSRRQALEYLQTLD